MRASTIEEKAGTAAQRQRSAPTAGGGNLPSLSVVIPCHNEAKFIGACLDSIVGNGYPNNRMEILVVDGMSGDGTRDIVPSCARKYPFIRLLDNPRGITPCALNIGIAAARGDVIMRVDAHATYEPGYVEYCVDALQRYGVDDTGGTWKVMARTGGIVGRAVVDAMTHRFGGAARYRRTAGGEPQLVDLVPFFCCRRETLTRAGQFNERLIRHQDFEYNVRLRRMGVRFMLMPRAVCNYYARTDLKSFCVHSFRDGLWVILAAAYSDVLPLSLRHVTPLVFVLALIAGCVAAPFSTLAGYGLGFILAAYAGAALFSAAQIAARENNLGRFFITPPIFAARHLMFGLGSLIGLVRVVSSRGLWHQLTRDRRTTASRARQKADTSDLNRQAICRDTTWFPTIGGQVYPGRIGSSAIKRTIDIVASLVGLLVFSPLLITVAALIKLDSDGPIFFRQERIGRGFRPFVICKFRTMVKDAAKLGAPITIGEDPRITRVGRFLRRTKIDELPQLFNVLKGDMSLVGPRPELRRYVAAFRHEYRQILTVRPGLTDIASLKFIDEARLLAQASDPERAYRDCVLPEKLALAEQYIRGHSLRLDAILLAHTLWRLLRRP